MSIFKKITESVGANSKKTDVTKCPALCQRILVLLFKYREAINGVRDPYILPYELPFPESEAVRVTKKRKEDFCGIAKTYRERWEDVHKERANLYPNLIEAEVLWGDELKNLFQILVEQENKLVMSVRGYIEAIKPPEDWIPPADAKEIQERKLKRESVYDNFYSDVEKIQDDFKSGCANIENYIKSKICNQDELENGA